MRSVWMAKQLPEMRFSALQGDIETDVIVVGAGMTGVLTSVWLGSAGLRVVLLESNIIGASNTGLSTGNLYAPVSTGMRTLSRQWGGDVLQQVAQGRTAAVAAIEALVREEDVPCGFVRCPLHVYVERPDPASLDDLGEEFNAYVEAGLGPEWVKDSPLRLRITRGLAVQGQAQFNPYQFVRGLLASLQANGVQVYEHSPVIALDASPASVQTPRGSVSARHIVMATHTPLGFNLVQAEMEVYREYGVAAPMGVPVPPGIHWVRDQGRSLRGYSADAANWLVVVGEKHKTGEIESRTDYSRRLKEYAQARFDVAGVDFEWSAQQFRSADGLPYIGPSAHPNVWIATGFGADGLTWGALAAGLITAGITERSNPLASLLTPRRFTPVKSAATWGSENAAVVRHLVADRLQPGQVERFADVPCGEGRLVEVDGTKFAVYRSRDRELNVLSPVCPHLKCIVQWNPHAHSWDCPCHGSRFMPDGGNLEGPALSPLEQYEVDRMPPYQAGESR